MINACCNLYFCFIITVHGDIRHLENPEDSARGLHLVHGDIRHLEKQAKLLWRKIYVHGDIRHLENILATDLPYDSCSWRHTPFRKVCHATFINI